MTAGNLTALERLARSVLADHQPAVEAAAPYTWSTRRDLAEGTLILIERIEKLEAALRSIVQEYKEHDSAGIDVIYELAAAILEPSDA